MSVSLAEYGEEWFLSRDSRLSPCERGWEKILEETLFRFTTVWTVLLQQRAIKGATTHTHTITHTRLFL